MGRQPFPGLPQGGRDDDDLLEKRAAGALLGAFIGDALGLGPHWYYDLAALRRDYGDWIDDYTDPRPGRYHAGCQAGQLSQAGFILRLTLESLVARGGYDQADFCRRLDEELFPLLDGTPVSGPGGYTSQSIRGAWRRRVGQQRPWTETGGHADTTEAIERTLAIAVRYARQPAALAKNVAANTVLTQTDPTVVALTVAFGAVLGQLVQGHPLDARLSPRLMALVKEAPCTSTWSPATACSRPGPRARTVPGRPLRLPGRSFDPLLHGRRRGRPRGPRRAAVEGLPPVRHALAIYHQLPAAYYLAARFPTDFESAVLTRSTAAARTRPGRS